MRLMRSLCLLLLLLACAACVHAAEAPRPAAPRRVRLYLDCGEAACDEEFLRREIPWVDWVRDRADADVQVLISTQRTGSGGNEHKLFVTRLRGDAPASDTLKFVTPPATSDDDLRHRFAQDLEVLLARDAVLRDGGDRLEVRLRPAAAAAPAAAGPARDPWNRWVYRLSGNGYFNGEKTYQQKNLYGTLSASRVTEDFKLGASVNQNYAESRYTFDDGSRFTSISRGWSVNAKGVKSIAPHWSAGLNLNVYNSSYVNVQRSVGASPALEYDVFPYSESSRRELTLGYVIGPRVVRYVDVTLYDKTRETLWSHSFDATLSLRQPWGSLTLDGTAAQYLHDASKYRLSGYSQASLKLVRGLSLDFYASGSQIHDQLGLPRGAASDAQVIARQRQLATAYQYYATVGVSYTFGSIFQSVVNPRLDNSLGGF
jgi:hypothetical protein